MKKILMFLLLAVSVQAQVYITRDSVDAKLRKDFTSYPVYSGTTGEADVIPYRAEGDGNIYKLEVINLPISSATQVKVNGIDLTLSAQIVALTGAMNQLIELTTVQTAQINELYLLVGGITPIYPYAPYGLTGTPSLNSVVLTWSDSTTAPDFYSVAYADLQLNPTVPTYVVWSDSSTDTTETITGLVSGNPYSFRVRTIKNGIYSNVSNTYSITMQSLESGGIFIADMEEGDLSDFTSETDANNLLSASATDKIHGVYSMRLQFDETNETAFVEKTVANTTDYYFRFYIDLTGVPTIGAGNYANQTLFSLNAGARRLLQFYIGNQAYSLGRWLIYLQDSTGNDYFSDLTTFSMQKHLIEIHWRADASVGGTQVWIDSTLVIDEMGRNTSGYTITDIEFGAVQNSNADYANGDHIIFDDLRLDTDGRVPPYTVPEPPSDPEIRLEGDNGWFVDKNASVGGDGTSWATAWNSLASVVWSSLTVGDTLYISGGADSTVYYERFTVGRSGTSSNFITVTKGLSTGRNGRVIIDGSNDFTTTANVGLTVSSKSYIKISKLEIRGFWKNVAINYSNVVYLDSCKSTNHYWGVSLYDSDSTFVRWNYLLADRNTSDQTDALSGSINSNTFVLGNYIKVANPQSNVGHADCVQLQYNEEYLVIANNWLEGAEDYAVSVILEQYDKAGTTIMYNNVVVNSSYGGSIWYGTGTGVTRDYLIYNNTIVRKLFTASEVPQIIGGNVNTYFKNNIVYNLNTRVAVGLVGTPLLTNFANWNYNTYYTPITTAIVNTYTLAQWQALGADSNSTDATVTFEDYSGFDFRLAAGSEGLDDGTNLQSIVEGWGVEGVEWKTFTNPYMSNATGTTRDTTPDVGAF